MYKFGPLEELPAKKEDGTCKYHGVVGEEVTNIPTAWQEDVIALDEDDYGDNRQAKNVDVGLTPTCSASWSIYSQN